MIQHFTYPLSQNSNWTGLIDMVLDTGTSPLDPNAGKIVVDAPLEHFESAAIVRFNTNGILDTSFGSGAGYVTLSTLPSISVAVQPDDRIVVAGQTGGNTSTG